MKSVERVVIASLLVASFAAQTAQGQGGAPPASHGQTCLDTLSPSAMTRVTAFSLAVLSDTADHAARPAADFFNEMLGQHVRELLGATDDSVPDGEPVVTWRSLGPALRVTGYRDGHVTLRRAPNDPDRAELRPDTLSGYQLFARAAAARRDWERFQWPPTERADSIVFDIVTTAPTVDRHGVGPRLLLHDPVPVFRVLEPWLAPVSILKPPRLAYPEDNRQGGMFGTVILRFMVDTLGRPVAATIKDYWPSSQPRPIGALSDAYDEFVRAARPAELNARYEPARLGGCPVPQAAEQPFVFHLR